MEGLRGVTIFDRVDPGLLRTPTSDSETPPSTPAKPAPAKRKRVRSPRVWQRAMHIVAPIVWTYILVDTFVVDIELLVARQLPQAQPILQYRLLALTVGLLIAATFWRRRAFFVPLAYVAFYPFVLLGWKLPRYLWQQRNWTLTIGSLHVILGTLGGFRRGVYVWSATLLALALVLTDANWTRYLALALSVTLVGWTAMHMVVQAVRPHQFMRIQAEMFHWWAGKPERFALPRELRNLHGDRFDAAASNLVADRAANAVVTCYGGRFWADRLEDYAHSGAFMIFGALSVVRYAALLVLFLALANGSLYGVAPAQYAVDATPTWAVFAQYAGASLAFGDASGFAAVGDGARLVNLASGLLGVVVLGLVGVSLIFNRQYAADSGSTKDSIASIRGDCDGVEAIVHRDFFVALKEAVVVLDRWGNLLVRGLVAFSGIAPPGSMDFIQSLPARDDSPAVSRKSREQKRREQHSAKARKKRKERARGNR